VCVCGLVAGFTEADTIFLFHFLIDPIPPTDGLTTKKKH